MRDQIISDALEAILYALEIIQARYEVILKSEPFLLTNENLTLFDAIAMRLQVIGEKVKKIEQHAPGFWEGNGIDPKPIIRFRDFISHHYENVEFEIILDVCKNYLPDFENKARMLYSA
jgi:uncharacterized protein with HEPN domain